MRKSPGHPRIEEKDAAEPISSRGTEPRLAHGPPHGRHLRSRPVPKRARSEDEVHEDPAPLRGMLRFERGAGERGPPLRSNACGVYAHGNPGNHVVSTKIGLHSAEGTRVLFSTVCADWAYHARSRSRRRSTRRSTARRCPPALGKSRGSSLVRILVHTLPYVSRYHICEMRIAICVSS